MTISFETIPSNLRLPFVTAEFDASAAQQGPSLIAYRAILLGMKTGDGTAVANSVHKVTNADQVATLAGRGSMLHRMAVAWFANNKFTECRIGVLAEDAPNVIATGTVTVTGAATAAGTIHLYVAGEHLQITVASGDSASTIAAAIATEIGKHASGTVTFATAASGDDITVGGVTFVATAGAVVPGAATYSIDTGNPEAAASFAAQVSAHATTSALVRATANAAVVTLRAVAPGAAGEAVVLSAVDAVTTVVSGAALAGADDASDLPVHASVAAGVVTLHAKNGGPQGNDLDCRYNYEDGEELPAGVTLTIVKPSGGSGVPALTTLIAALGDTWYHVWAHPFTDATSLTALEAELERRDGPLVMIDGLAITSAAGSYATLSTLGGTRNSRYNCIVAQPGANPLSWPPEHAAEVAAVAAYYGNADPARPLQTLKLARAKQPAEADLFTIEERNLLLYDGIATTVAAAGGVCQIERLITTWQTNSAGSDDTSYLDATTRLTLMYLRYDWRNLVATKYPRHKLANDGTRFGAGQAIVTPKLMKAEAVAWFAAKEEQGLVEGRAQFKRDLICERNSSNPNRLDLLLPPDLINQLMTTATKFQFRL